MANVRTRADIDAQWGHWQQQQQQQQQQQLQQTRTQHEIAANNGKLEAFAFISLLVSAHIRDLIERDEGFPPNFTNPGETDLLPQLGDFNDIESALTNLSILGLTMVQPAALASMSTVSTRLIASQFRMMNNISNQQLFKNALVMLALGHALTAIFDMHPTAGLTLSAFIYAKLRNPTSELNQLIDTTRRSIASQITNIRNRFGV